MLTTTIAMLLISQGAEAGAYEEFVGVRSEAMGGAHRGVGTSNDTLYLNPAGMAISTRYSADLGYAYSGFDELNRFNASVVDSKSGPVAGGFGYTLVRGDSSGVDADLNRFNAAAAYRLGQALALGFSARHIRGSLSDVFDGDVRSGRDVRVWNGDIGVAGVLGSVAFGLVFQNVLEPDEEDEAFVPRTIGGGLSFIAGPLTLAGDVVSTVGDDSEFAYKAGAEYFFQDAYAVRAGYRYEPFIRQSGEADNENILSGGLGYVTGDGAFDATFKRSLDRSRNWTLIAAVRLFL
ncbi:MAG: outer membrane beta-barrel protein [Myxococcota bacterium]